MKHSRDVLRLASAESEHLGVALFCKPLPVLGMAVTELGKVDEGTMKP